MNIEEIMQKIVSGEISIKQALEDASRTLPPSETSHRLAKYIGKNVFIRTVTHHYTGHFVGISDGFITLRDAAWIADDGRFNEAIGKGNLNEVEPYPTNIDVDIGVGSILDMCEWMHKLPREVK